MNKIITRTAEISYTPENRILRIKIIEGAEIELSDALQNFEATKLLTKNDRYLILVDGRVSLSISREARAFAAESKNDDSIASAMIITSTANKLIGNFYININKPSIPTRIFSSEEKAIEWLSGFLYQTEETENKLTSLKF
ncbi:MAG: hypothetical protein K0S44_1993 [Bacteroidetes bacterium]|jgi:hypothetical protein|nr:hypothetical protein [Bacteroidota bacterium]